MTTKYLPPAQAEAELGDRIGSNIVVALPELARRLPSISRLIRKRYTRAQLVRLADTVMGEPIADILDEVGADTSH